MAAITSAYNDAIRLLRYCCEPLLEWFHLQCLSIIMNYLANIHKGPVHSCTWLIAGWSPINQDTSGTWKSSILINLHVLSNPEINHGEIFLSLRNFLGVLIGWWLIVINWQLISNHTTTWTGTMYRVTTLEWDKL